MKNKKKLLGTVLAAALLLFGCGEEQSDLVEQEQVPISQEVNTPSEGFYYEWAGEKITPELAAEKGCIMMGDNGTGAAEWCDFLIDLAADATGEITICTDESVMQITESASGGTAVVQVKKKYSGRVISYGRIISPVEVCCVRNEESDTLDYYLSDVLINSMPAAGNVDLTDVPADFQCFRVSSDAAVTFPYQKHFSSFGDFESYYDLYHDSLGLDEVRQSMSDYNSEGGFNTHIVFLYGDMSAGDPSYTFLRAVKENGTLTFYLKQQDFHSSDSVSKWQLLCSVPGEYLSDVAPDKVKWVVYDDRESRG